jgi:O-antigen ligase
VATEAKNRSPSRALWNRDTVDAWTETGILGLTLAVVVYAVLAMGAVRPSEFVVVQFLAAGILALWLVRYGFGGTHRLLWPPIGFPASAFLLYAFLLHRRADIEYAARLELLQVLVYGVIFFAVVQVLHRQGPTRILAITLVVLGVAVSLYALTQYLTGSEYVWNQPKPRVYLHRASGPYVCPDHLAGLLCLLLPLAVSYTITGRFKMVVRVCFGYAAIMMLVGLGVTVSHGGWLAVACGLSIFFATILRQRSYRVIGAVSLVLILAGAVVFGLYQMKSGEAQGQSPSVLAAKAPWKSIWPAAWRIAKDHLWLGTGPGSFDFRYRQYREATPEQQFRPERAHNDYLNTLADWGIVGASLMGAALVLFFWGVTFAWGFIARKASDLNHKKSNKSAFVFGSCLGVINLMVFSLYDFNMHIPANVIVAVVLMAMVSGHLRFATDRFWVSQRRLGRPVAMVILGSALVYLSLQSLSLAREQQWLKRARKLADEPAAQFEVLRKAFAAQPRNYETAYALGENLRLQGWLEPEKEKTMAEAALEWYRRVPPLNPYDPYSHLRIGMCLHTLGRGAEAGQAFQAALKLDPNGLFTLAHVGWHYLQLGDYQMARTVFLKVKDLESGDMEVAEPYLNLIEEKLRPKPASQVL